jgi:chorismate synthase
MPEVTIRPLTSETELAEGVAIQRLTWGDRFTELVPASVLQISQKVGGVAAGAFDPNGHMVGFVFGLSGVRHGRLVHWSHMLAVRPEARGMGLGKRLKVYQRDVLLAAGIVEVRWTFDPLVAQNANLNLNALGADVEDYVPDMYGGDTGSDLHSGLGTDRLIVLWMIGDAKVERAIAGKGPALPAGAARAPVANPGAVLGEMPAGPVIRIEVPPDIQHVKATSFQSARAWRDTTRRAFLRYLERGYRVSGFAPGGEERPSHYLLTWAEG